MEDGDNQQQKQKMAMEDDQDLISKLPTDILSTIISSLGVREAVRTSVISAKWRYLWTSPASLILDAENMLKQQDYSYLNDQNMRSLPQSLVLSHFIKVHRTVCFIKNVNLCLSHLYEVHKIEKMKVYFTFFHHGCANYYLDHWITFAIQRNVQEIDLCLFEDDQFIIGPRDGKIYDFPCDLLAKETEKGFKSSLKRLRLAYCTLGKHNSDFSGFSTLTTMDLTKVDLVSSAKMQNLLSNCHNLEQLSLSECRNMSYLKIEHPFCQKMKYLKVIFCHQLKAIKLKDINLESFEYTGCIIEFIQQNCPRLGTVLNYVTNNVNL